MNNHALGLRCECGREIMPAAADAYEHQEFACACGRRHDLLRTAQGWSSVAQLTPERSVPLSGFSIELRAAPDAERFWFRYPVQGDVPLPVHVVVSRSAARAEVKTGAQKVFAIEHEVSATEARRLWVSWWQAKRKSLRGPHTLLVPSRIGRLPHRLSPRA
jgi:hypothetical protein